MSRIDDALGKLDQAIKNLEAAAENQAAQHGTTRAAVEQREREMAGAIDALTQRVETTLAKLRGVRAAAE
jgi:hypothetical protein